MAVTEQARLALRDAARATLGQEEGDTLMAITAPANTYLATRQDLERLQENIVSRIELRIVTSIAELRTEISELRTEMIRSDAQLRADMNQANGQLRADMNQANGQLRSDMNEADGQLRSAIIRSDGELRSTMATSLGELRADMIQSDGELRQQIARSANTTLRWVLATVLLAQGGTIGHLMLR